MPKPNDWTSHTELSRLAHCEMSWKLRYIDGIKSEPSDAMRLGTLVHHGVAALNRGSDWRKTLAADIAEEGADPALVVLEALDADTPASTAVWLLERYSRYYEDDRAGFCVTETELELTATLPDGQTHLAYVDEVWEDNNGDAWIVERKTFGRGDRIAWVEVDPQLTLNLWVARANNIPAVGIVFDGIYTYRWKPEKPTLAQIEEKLIRCGFQGTKKELREQARGVQADESTWTDRPDADSFTRLWLDRTDEQIEAALADVVGTLERRETIRAGGRPVRNIGPHCMRCDQRTKCWEMLAFPQDIVFDVEDD